MFSPMERTFKDALDFALRSTKRSLRSVAISAGVSYEQLKGLMQGKARTTNVDDGVRVAAAFGVSVEDFFAGRFDADQTSIAVAGRVGAGAHVDLVDAYEKGDGLYRVTCPPQLSPRGLVAVEVAGDSMAPIYSPGTVLFYSREALGVPVEAVGHICVCEDEGGKAWVKVIKTGSQEGTFSLISVNPEAENMHGIRLKWAARVRFNLPPELVERVG
jgi:phage repressor protein C with HTH and peptisase S24 domain